LRTWRGGSKIGARRSYSIAAIACLPFRNGCAVGLGLLCELYQIHIVECFDPSQPMVWPRWMRQNKIINALDASRRQRPFIAR
jgi:hypothetical protein